MNHDENSIIRRRAAASSPTIEHAKDALEKVIKRNTLIKEHDCDANKAKEITPMEEVERYLSGDDFYERLAE